MGIKKLPAEEKPREKALISGIRSLSDSELLALVIQSGTREEDAIALSYHLITKANGLYGLSQASINELKLPGIGIARGLKLMAAFELGRRASRQAAFKEPFRTSAEIAQKFGPELAFEKEEKIKAVFLDRRCRYIREEIVAEGGSETARCRIQDLLKKGLDCSSFYVYLLHNHPSGNSSPSEEDIGATKFIAQSFSSIGIKMLDHIVVSGNRYYSIRLASEGKIESI